jgi:hypothetical protein
VRFLFTISSIIFLLTGCALLTQAQVKKDSVEKKSITKKAFREGMKLISTSPQDTIVNEKSVDPYLIYAGKIIRDINIERIGFEKSIYDSAKKVKKTVTKLSNTLHVDTRSKIIRKHLFIHSNEPLNPSELADNERFLRDKDFILDCRIVVAPIEGTDSVDLTVITRDVFSLGAIGGGSPTTPKFGIYDANVDGRGQRIQVDMLLDAERTPNLGYSLLYRKSSILGSLTNLELRYTQLNSGRSVGDENEYATFIRLDRPLVSPYSRIAGGGEVSWNWSVNVEDKPDSTFLKYNYKVLDYWFGYNIGIKKEIENRNRKFLAFRHFDGVYTDQPDQELYNITRKYNSLYGYLSEFTFYRQNFYKTRYVLGFGRTEDVPYGFTLGFTGGYVKQLRIERPYAAIKFNYGSARKKGDFLRFSAQAGGYYRNNEMEDVVLQGGVSYFTRLFQFNRYKMRNYITTTYTQLVNHRVIDWLKIDKKEIPGFRSDSLNADKRFALHAETILFTPGSILGFRFAPFGSVDMVAVNCVACVTDNDLFWGYSAGLRTRNENLIFGTMEAKFTYIPQDQYGNSKFVFGFKQNLQIKNTGSFVKAPSLVLYN